MTISESKKWVSKSVFYAVISMSLLIVLGACSTKNEKAVEPAKLKDISQTVQIKKRWESNVGSGFEEYFVGVQPVVAGQFLYAADSKGRLVALDRETGKRLWKVKTGDEITGGVNAAFDMVVYGSGSGFIVARNASNGAEMWRKELSSEVLAAPALSSEIVLVQTIDGHLYGLERTTGERKWVYDTNVPVLTLRGESSPQIVNNIALAGFANGKLIALNVADGIPLWEKQVAVSSGRSELERIVDLDGGFWVQGGIVYAATYQGKIVAIEVSSGRLLWQRDMSSHLGVVAKLGNVYVPDADGKVWALDANSGSEVWHQQDLEARKLSPPAIIDDYILVGDFQGYLHWISRKDGSFAGRVKVDQKGLRIKPIVQGDTVYVQGNSGLLLALEISEKELKPRETIVNGKRRYRREIRSN